VDQNGVFGTRGVLCGAVVTMESYEQKLKRTIAEAKAKSEHIKASRHRVILLDAKELKKCMKSK
jgi:hypothetical protein